jgi:hypothetical protein
MRDIKSNADIEPRLCVVMPVFNEAAQVPRPPPPRDQ